MENKIFMTFGIVTILSGIGLVLMKLYLVGIAGSIVGIWLTTDNLKKIRAQKKQ